MRTLIFPTDLQPLLTQALSTLDSPDIVTHMGVTQDDLLKLHFDHHARLIVTRPDLPGMGCESLVHVIRRNEAVSNVSIMLLVPDAALDTEQSRACGANVTLPLSTPAPIVGRKIEELLDVPPRRPYRMGLHMLLKGVPKDRSFICNMENISSHGILIRSSEHLALGDRVSCSFHLPLGRTVSATGSIVRVIAGTAADPQQRYGVRFVNLSEIDAAAIAAFVDQGREHLKASGDEHKAGGK